MRGDDHPLDLVSALVEGGDLGKYEEYTVC